MNAVLAATVLFSGLILHYETNPSTHQKNAYLLKAPRHTTPRVLVTSGFVSESGFAGTLGSGFVLGPNKQYIIVTSDMTGGVNEMADFKNRVPHLPQILDDASAKEHPNVKAGKNHNSHATVTYVRGDLGIEQCFKDAIKFSPHIMTEQCLPRSVKLTITTDRNWEIREVGDPTNTIVIAPNGQVKIENAAASTAVLAHQKHYKDLLDRNANVDDIVRLGKMCDVNTCAVITRIEEIREPSPLVECSNTQWP